MPDPDAAQGIALLILGIGGQPAAATSPLLTKLCRRSDRLRSGG